MTVVLLDFKAKAPPFTKSTKQQLDIYDNHIHAVKTQITHF